MRGAQILRYARRLALAALLLVLIGLGVWLTTEHLLAEGHLRRAAEALERQRYTDALAQYRAALGYRPRSATLHLLAGRTARRSGDLRAARDFLRKCRELQGGVSEEQQVEDYLLRAQSGELDEVRRYLVPYLVQEGPLTPLVLEGLARAYMASYQVGAAWQCITRWLELEPDNVEALSRRATWYLQQQNLKEAAADYERILGLDPGRVGDRLAYAEILRIEKKKVEDIPGHYEAVLREAPGNPIALIGLAQFHLDAGNPEAAGPLLDRLPADRRESAEALWLRGMIEMQSNRPEAAEGYLRRALEREPRHLEACYNLMLCLSRLGRAEEARAMNERYDRINEDQKRLVELTTRELSANPSSPDLRCELGEIYLRLGVPDRGVFWLRDALRIDPTHRRAHERLRDYYGSLGPEGKEQADFHRQQLSASR